MDGNQSNHDGSSVASWISSSDELDVAPASVLWGVASMDTVIPRPSLQPIVAVAGTGPNGIPSALLTNPTAIVESRSLRLSPILASAVAPSVAAAAAVGSTTNLIFTPVVATPSITPTYHSTNTSRQHTQTSAPNHPAYLSSPLYIFRNSNAAVITVAAFALFTDMAIYGIVIPILPQIITVRLGMDTKYLGILLSGYAAGLILVTPIIGILSDRFKNRKVPMIIGIMFMIIAASLYAFGNTFGQLFLARMCQGVSGGVSWTIGFCMLADIFPQSRLGAVMGSVLMANTFGFLIGPPLGGVFFEFIGERSPFLFCALLAFLDLMARLFIRPGVSSIRYKAVSIQDVDEDSTDTESEQQEDNQDSNDLHDRNSHLVASVCQPLLTPSDRIEYESVEVAENLFPQRIQQNTMLDLVKDSQILVTLLCVIISSSVFAGIEPTLPIYLSQELKASPSLVGALWIFIAIPSMLGCSWAGHISDKYGRKNVMAFGMLFFAIASPMLALGKHMFILIPGLICFSLSNAVALTPAMPEMADFMHARDDSAFGTVYALYNLAYSSGQLIGPIAGSFLFQRFDFMIQMQVFGVALLLGAPIAYIFYVKSLKVA
ncbi:hypothetical protein O5D80_002835 [Batrachochytrium dendrobatidis]|nr:hypothetical protein O5D80_002835 [Batrachochytrium dendrobatidis]